MKITGVFGAAYLKKTIQAQALVLLLLCAHNVLLGCYRQLLLLVSIPDHVIAAPLKFISLASTSVKGHRIPLTWLPQVTSSRNFCCTRMGQQGINTLSSTPSLAARLLFVAWSFAELSDSISRGVKWWKRTCGSVVSCWAFCLAGMYEGEAFMGICATAAVVDPLELVCYSSHPSPEICLSEEQQSLSGPRKGLTALRWGHCSSSHRNMSQCPYGLIGLCVAWGIWISIKTFPLVSWACSSCCEGWSLGNISCLEIFHTNKPQYLVGQVINSLCKREVSSYSLAS